ncbi:MAG: C40 family peptidase [Vicinamibacterales bacterium]
MAALRLCVIAVVALSTAACATRGGVPRPFPGAGVPAPADASPEDAGPPVPVPGAPEAGTPADTPPLADGADDPTAAGILETALALLGVPYRNGGADPSGFDCSGFVQYVFGRHGVSLPRQTSAQYHEGTPVALGDVRAGDLVFFETVSRGASHVGLALGDGRFVHAPSSRGVVRVERYSLGYWARRVVGVRRLQPAPGQAAQ